MPLPLWGIQAIGSGINFLTNLFNRPKPFSQTAYGRRLRQLSEQGTYSPTAKSNILSQIGAQTANVAQQNQVGYKGRLISQGMGGSIAGQRGMSEFDLQRINQMGDVAKKIETENELSKAQYATQYAQAADEYGQQRQAYDRNTVMGLVQGATSAMGTYAQESAQQQDLALKDYKGTGLTKGEWTQLALKTKLALMEMKRQYPQLTPMPNNILQMTPEEQDAWILSNAKDPQELEVYRQMLLMMVK